MSIRLSTLASSEEIKSFALGAAQNSVQPVAEFIAPGVEVYSPVFHYAEYTEKNRFRIPATKRSPGGKATKLVIDRAQKTGNVTPNALDYDVDELEQIANPEDMLKEGVTMLAEAAGLAHEKTVIDAALTASGAGTDIDITTANTNLVDLLDDEILKVIKAAKYGSLMGVGVLFGATAWKRFKNHTSVEKKMPGRQIISPNLTDATQLLISNPEVRASFMVYDDAAEGLEEEIKFVLDTAVLVFARRPSPTRRDPSFMKTFRLAGKWMVPGAYTREDGRGEVAKFDWSEQVAVTNSAAVSRLNLNLS